jgi:hypothetical protein
MAKAPFAIPPGMARHGTIYQSKGRWYRGNLVRFFNGAIRPVGGWNKLQRTDSTATTTVNVSTSSAVPRCMLAWRGLSDKPWLAIGTDKKLFSFAEGVLTDISPVGLAAGQPDASYDVGPYGGAADQNYGQFAYGLGDPTIGQVVEPGSWQLDNFGQYLIGCLSSDGGLYLYTLSGVATAISGAPTGCAGVVVTPEHFVLALGAGNNPRLLKWASQDTTDKWDQDHVANPQYNDGDLELQGDGRIMTGRRGRSETLVWTDAELYVVRYVGGVLVYGQERVGTNCGIISRQAVSMIDGTAVWMSTQGFHRYEGYVQPLASEVADAVFSDFNFAQKAKVCSYTIAQFGEVWWHYPSASSMENDRYVVWNYRENHWTLGELGRTCGVDRGAFDYPILANAAGDVFEHEKGWDHENVTPYLESGPREIGQGDEVMSITQAFPDDRHRGDVQFTIFGAFYPQDDASSEPANPEIAYGPYTLTAPLDLRITARQIRLKVTEATPGDWRFGVPRFEVDSDGLR